MHAWTHTHVHIHTRTHTQEPRKNHVFHQENLSSPMVHKESSTLILTERLVLATLPYPMTLSATQWLLNMRLFASCTWVSESDHSPCLPHCLGLFAPMRTWGRGETRWCLVSREWTRSRWLWIAVLIPLLRDLKWDSLWNILGLKHMTSTSCAPRECGINLVYPMVTIT